MTGNGTTSRIGGFALVALGGLFLASLPTTEATAQSGDTEIAISAGVSYLTGDFGATRAGWLKYGVRPSLRYWFAWRRAA